MVENIFISAFLMGLLGSTHCVAMCGGIVGMLSQQCGDVTPGVRNKTLGMVLTYNGARIASYCLIGVLAGFIGQLGFGFFNPSTAL